MKYIILLFFIITVKNCFGQKKEKEYLLEIIKLEQLNHKLKLDSIRISEEIRNVKRWTSYEVNRIKWINDSLRWELSKIKRENIKLEMFKNQIFKLSDSTVIIYKDENRKICYLNLSAYELTLKQNDVIILQPIEDKTKWTPPIVDGYPKPKNLSIYLYPHKIDGNKLILQP